MLGQPRFPSKFGLSSSCLSAVVYNLVMSLVGTTKRRQQTLPGVSTDAVSTLNQVVGDFMVSHTMVGNTWGG